MKRDDREMRRAAARVWEEAERLRMESIGQVSIGPRTKLQHDRCKEAEDRFNRRQENED